VSLLKHTAFPKRKNLAHFIQNRPSQTKMSNFLFLTLPCVLTNMSQNYNGT
jgi:hypothetical protein